jgi:hypothetical protein
MKDFPRQSSCISALKSREKCLKNPINNFTNKDFAKILKDLAMGKYIFGESTLFC